MALTTLSNEQGWLKAGFLGYAKSGKTYTATKLAIGIKQFFKIQAPIAFFDTESGSGYVSEMVKTETGQDLIGVRARAFKDLIQFTQDCVNEKIGVALIDSVTHPWKELCDSYLVQLNQRRKERNLAPLQKLEFAHWAAIKGMWEPWPNFFLNSKLHIIVCGRAGGVWEFERNEETGRRELIQTGVKMKVETEFGFESSLLCEMEREQQPDGQGGFKVTHRATVLGDRFNVLDGATALNPTFDFFLPHIQKLKPGAHAPVDTDTKTQTGADEEGDGDWQREKRQRTILCEEIQGMIVSEIPGQGADDKKRKADLLQKVFGTRSWTSIENTRADVLRERIPALKTALGIKDVEPSSEDDGDTGPVLPASDALAAGVRLLCRASKITETTLLGFLGEMGSAPTGLQSLEQVPEAALKMVADQWGDISKRIKEATGGA